MRISLHSVKMHSVIDGDNLTLRVEYTPENGDTTVDYGQYIISSNVYYPSIDLNEEPKRENEYYELQERVENRG